MNSCEDIRHLSRPPSRHPKMKQQERAKIFSPFAALSGHEEAVHARDRVPVPPIHLTEFAQELLNEKLSGLQKGDAVTVLYFLPERNSGGEVLGEYVTANGRVQAVDALNQVLGLDVQEIPFGSIAELYSQEARRSPVPKMISEVR